MPAARKLSKLLHKSRGEGGEASGDEEAACASGPRRPEHHSRGGDDAGRVTSSGAAPRKGRDAAAAGGWDGRDGSGGGDGSDSESDEVRKGESGVGVQGAGVLTKRGLLSALPSAAGRGAKRRRRHRAEGGAG